MNTDTHSQDALEGRRVYTDADRRAESAHAVLAGSADKAQRSEQLSLLGSLAEKGSAVAQYHLGEILYGGAAAEDRRRGLHSHLLAAQAGYLRSLVAIQKHEDPLLRRFDLLHDPTPTGVAANVVSVVHGHRYARIALLVEGLEQGVAGYGLELAEELLDEVNFAPAARVGPQETHLLALAYGLIRNAHDAALSLDGPGSAVAIEENRAVAAGFGSLGDWKAREHIATSEMLAFFSPALAAQLRAFKDPRSSPIPHVRGLAHADVIDYGADALVALVSELGRLSEHFRGSGINLLTGVLWFLCCVELGRGWSTGGAMAAELSLAYRALGGAEGLRSYLTRVFTSSASIRYTRETTSDKSTHHSTALGEHLGSNNRREVLTLDRETSRFERREESWGRSQIYLPNTTNVQSEHEQAVVTEGHFVLSVHAGKAGLSLCAEKKSKHTKVTRRDVKMEEQIRRWRSYSSTDLERCTTTQENTEPVVGFRAHEFLPLDWLSGGQTLRRQTDDPGHASGGSGGGGAPSDVDQAIERIRLHQWSRSARGQAIQAARSAVSAIRPALKAGTGLPGAPSGGFMPADFLLAPWRATDMLSEMKTVTAYEAVERDWRRLRAQRSYRRTLPFGQSPPDPPASPAPDAADGSE